MVKIGRGFVVFRQRAKGQGGLFGGAAQGGPAAAVQGDTAQHLLVLRIQGVDGFGRLTQRFHLGQYLLHNIGLAVSAQPPAPGRGDLAQVGNRPLIQHCPQNSLLPALAGGKGFTQPDRLAFGRRGRQSDRQIYFQ